MNKRCRECGTWRRRQYIDIGMQRKSICPNCGKYEIKDIAWATYENRNGIIYLVSKEYPEGIATNVLLRKDFIFEGGRIKL